MKKFLLLVLFTLILAGCSATTGAPETNKNQVERLLKEAEKKEKERAKTVKIEAAVIDEKTEEVVETAVEEVKKSNPHEGMTRGEIMQYEMEKVRAEMAELQTSVNDYAQRVKILKEHKEKLEKLENLNRASMK